MLASVVQPSVLNPGSSAEEASSSFSSLLAQTKRASENVHYDAFSSAAPTIASRPESGVFTKLNESVNGGFGGSGIDIDTAGRDHGGIGGLERQVKPPGAPLRKTRAVTADVGSRRGLTNRNAKDINNEVPKRTTSQMVAESGVTATRRSTRLLNTKLTSKFVTGGSIADRSGVNAKEREVKKSKAIGSRTKSSVQVAAAAAEKLGKARLPESDPGSVDIAVGSLYQP